LIGDCTVNIESTEIVNFNKPNREFTELKLSINIKGNYRL